MRRIRLIFTLLNPNRNNEFLRSKIASFSTFSSPHRSSFDPQIPEHCLPSHGSWSHTSFARESTSSNSAETAPPKQELKFIPTERVSAIVDEISGLTVLECQDLFEVLKEKLGATKVPQFVVMKPGGGFSGKGPAKGAGGSKEEEKKVEKTAFDLKLEGFEAAAKIKIIKEVRTFTDLGLKEAKDLVEKAPTLLKKGVLKEEAEKIIEKMKELGAKVVME